MKKCAKRSAFGRCFIGLLVVMIFGLNVPAIALTWNTDHDLWSESVYLPVGEWERCIEVDGIRSKGYVKYDDNGIAANVCYCDVPARVTLLEWISDSGSVNSYASPWDLGSSVVRVSIADNGEIVKGASVVPTFKRVVDDEEYGACNGAGTYWDLTEGIYYMSCANASRMLYLVVGDVLDDNANSFVFEDVSVNAYYYEPVNWAVENGITSGTSETTFSPNQTCTQAQILTFLWRAANEEVAVFESPYSNSTITADKYYYQPMLWAWSRGLLDDVDLNPQAECRRSDVVNYLWKLSDKPDAVGNAFNDVPEDADYANAVVWAVNEKITSGTGENTFSPESSCTRGQIVTFLYKYFVQLKNI